jgi:hypothetical protein
MAQLREVRPRRYATETLDSQLNVLVTKSQKEWLRVQAFQRSAPGKRVPEAQIVREAIDAQRRAA